MKGLERKRKRRRERERKKRKEKREKKRERREREEKRERILYQGIALLHETTCTELQFLFRAPPHVANCVSVVIRSRHKKLTESSQLLSYYFLRPIYFSIILRRNYIKSNLHHTQKIY